MILHGTAAGGDEGGAEEQAAVDEDANNSNVADKSSKPTSPSGQSQHADDTAAIDTSVASEYSVMWYGYLVFSAPLFLLAVVSEIANN